MMPYKKLSTILCVSVVCFLPKKTAQACGPWPSPPEEYRISFFQSNITDTGKELTAYYFSLNKYYKSLNFDEYATQVETDQNYREWKDELGNHFSKNDFYVAINKLSYQVVTDSANQLQYANSFIKALYVPAKKELLAYFMMAKRTEQFNSVFGTKDPWGLNNTVQAAPLALVDGLQKMLTDTHDNFIKQRTAYLLCRLLFYINQKSEFLKIYDANFAHSTNKSWVNASADYYKVRLLNNEMSAAFMGGIVDIIDRSKDKRMVCIQLINQVKRENSIPLLKTNHEKATALAAYAIRYPAYALQKIKEIDALDHTNKFIPLLINREVNKIEDWLLTPVYTEFGTSGSKDSYSDDDKFGKYYKNQNLASDSLYAVSLKKYIEDIIHKREDRDFSLTTAVCQLDLLLKNYAGAQAACKRIIAACKQETPQYLQARINLVVIDMMQKKKCDDLNKQNLVSVLLLLDKLQATERSSRQFRYDVSYQELKDGLLVFMGRSLFKWGNIADAALLLSGTEKPWGEYQVGAVKNAYFLLYEHAKPKDFEAILTVLKKKNKSAFEKYFCNRKVFYYGNYTTYESYYSNYYTANEKARPILDINKVLDLEGTYYVNTDEIEKAISVFKQIPAGFWTDSNNLYRQYLTGNPFELSVYDPHQFRGGKSYKDNPNKVMFLQQLLDYKRKLAVEKDPEKQARLNYIIGNAYYNMSYQGTFWLMSKLWWSSEEPETLRLKPFELNYYGTVRAKVYYARAIALTRNRQKAAFYCIYLTQCENNRLKMLAQAGSGRNSAYGNEYEPNPFIYIHNKYREKIDEKFYRMLIKECPLYLDFKKGI
ncbi:MAG: hypothetical protein V4450_03050 [Bacteroidota bacterium]